MKDTSDNGEKESEFLQERKEVKSDDTVIQNENDVSNERVIPIEIEGMERTAEMCEGSCDSKPDGDVIQQENNENRSGDKEETCDIGVVSVEGETEKIETRRESATDGVDELTRYYHYIYL